MGPQGKSAASNRLTVTLPTEEDEMYETRIITRFPNEQKSHSLKPIPVKDEDIVIR